MRPGVVRNEKEKEKNLGESGTWRRGTDRNYHSRFVGKLTDI